MRRTGLLLLLIVLAANPADAQEPGETPVQGETEAGEAAFDTAGTEEQGPADLLETTLAKDIDTAGYYELVAWCRDLGLDDSGGRRELQARLYAFYRITPSVEQVPEGRILEILQAGGSEYFTLEGIEENYILLEGDVLVEFQEDDSVHSIRAERIILNQTEDILTAEGNIEYRLTQGEEEEIFTGERLSFSVESWEGVFFRGGLTSEREIEGKPLTFVFRGESITKLENDTIVLRNGRITSCENLQDPHYHLRARKIWVLAPNEWAISSARLYIGRIPVFYLPFFFHAGDEFFFHPVIGYRSREGHFIQTTSYLIGQKQREKSAFSFLSATEDSLNTLPRRREGLFLRQIEEEEQAAVETDRYLKVFLDFYSRLGLFSGIEGDFPPEVGFKGGLARSRSLFKVAGEYETFLDSAGAFDSQWNEAQLFGWDEFPLRYGLEADWSLSSGRAGFNGRFEYFSDPYFVKDFYNRSEDFSWTGTLGGTEETALATVTSERWNLSWELNANANFLREPPSWLKSFSLTSLSAKIFWQSREQDTSLLTPEEKDLLAVDPARRFYYPVSMKLPSASMLISGDILDLSSSPAPPAYGDTEKDAEAQEEVPGKGYRDPISQPGEAVEEAAPKEEAPDLRLPPAREDAGVQPAGETASFRLSYRIQPNTKLEEAFSFSDWTEPEDVDWTVREAILTTDGSSSLDYSLQLYESLFGLSGSLVYDGKYQTRFDGVYDASSELSTSLGASLAPLRRVPKFSASTLSYTLDWTFYRYLSETAMTTAWQWRDDTVGKHSLLAKLAYKPGTRENSLSFTTQLPPQLNSYTASLVFYVWKLKTTVSEVLKETASSWVWQPLVVQEILELSEDVRFTEELRFDVEESLLLKSISTLNLWNLSSSFTAERLLPVSFDTGDGSWDTVGTEEEFMPSLASIAYKLIDRSSYIWKNRLRLDTDLNSSWSLNLQRFTENSMDFSLTFKLWIYKFMELNFSTVSTNQQTYLYFRKWAEEAGQEWRNPIRDLLDSFNFFEKDQNARKRSAFKLKSLSVSLVHHLHDWDLSFEYQGKPELYPGDGRPFYAWNNTFSIFLKWVPIPELSSQIRYGEDEEGGEWTIRG
jgi:hypothetical protein